MVIEVPGVRKSDLRIEAKGNTIRIAGTRTVEHADNGSVHRVERRGVQFDRAVTLPIEIGRNIPDVAVRGLSGRTQTDGSKSWEDPRKGEGRRGDEEDAVPWLSRGVVRQVGSLAGVAANGLVQVGWGVFRISSRKGLFADLNHRVLLRATCRAKCAGPKKVALRGGRFGFRRGGFKGSAALFLPVLQHHGTWLTSSVSRSASNHFWRATTCSTFSRRGSPCFTANSFSRDWMSQRSSSDHSWPAGMNAHLKDRAEYGPSHLRHGQARVGRRP